ncbi:maleylpyruvate isomerase family mycothiol-dependent enzyme [Dactylosporangium sp. AC04546]|uniref:maleylpyruvate isomerase family mycothiol-dependent enzyme n=1 Tax=Dactylosporangium sp. AC04546 TaxID=2862460 RepID=UPI001EE143E0|nr:maleylpyruvate isomerase family mycothiol-dependent enzyme [Dactylosporangium sp. AC04546]WVK83453.1 maleylpyruvate isomerase family mycothiol-dependent enzyme [Dactylosporangium sp. AC04546]
MERSRLLECLADDYLRLRTVAGRDLTAPVPSCPEWTTADLVRHVAEVYLHKAMTMRAAAFPDPWPPEHLAAEESVALLDRAYGELIDEFARRADAEATPTWHKPDQTVRFWIRRMAQESVIHRIDAELALGAPVAPIPDDLAVDGIDEVLKLFVDYGTHAWPGEFTTTLSAAKGRTLAVQVTDGPAWLVRTDPDAVTVTDAAPSALSEADALIHGAPAPVLRWLWARESIPTDDAQPPVTVEGDEEALREFRSVLVASTQ